MENIPRLCTKNYTHTQLRLQEQTRFMCSGAAPKLSLTGAEIHQILYLKYPTAFWLQVEIINNQAGVPTPPTVEEQKEGNQDIFRMETLTKNLHLTKCGWDE